MKDLHDVADSDSRSLIIVPVEFSRCIELHKVHSGDGNGPSLGRKTRKQLATRINQSGLMTERKRRFHLGLIELHVSPIWWQLQPERERQRLIVGHR